MAQELQSLISRIQEEGVSKAQAESEKIIAEAKRRAGETVKQAEEQASARLKQAEKEAAQFEERARKTLEQAGRDLLIAVGRGAERIFENIVRDAVRESLSAKVLEEMLVKVVEAYVKSPEGAARVDLLLNEKDGQTLAEFFKKRFAERMAQGLEVRADGSIAKGFKVELKDQHVAHDFTDAAITESLMNFLRPDLAEIVHQAARKSAG